MKKILYLVMLPLFISCGNTAQKSISQVEADSLAVIEGVDSVVVEDYEEDYYSEEAINDSQTEVGITFNPVSSTISDSEGSFSSSDFDCPSMVVYDKGSSVELSWGGENIPLSQSTSPDTYIASQSKSGTTMQFVAYRSSSTRQIYLVICTTKGNGKSVEINFKP
jgi:hypothetical protein